MSLANKINELVSKGYNCNTFSIYDYNDDSLQDLLCRFFTKINECIKVSNETIDLAQWLVNEGLTKEVTEKLLKWLADGTLAGVINDVVFKDIQSHLTSIDTYRVNIKNFVNNSIGTVDVTEGFLKAIDYIEKMSVNTINLPWDAKTKGKIILDLNNGTYLINKKIVLSPNQMSLVTMQNGTLIASDDFVGNRMLDVGNGGHSYQNIINNICFKGNKKVNGIYLDDTLNTQIKNCMFIDIVNGIDSNTNCHESIIKDNYFLWSDYATNHKGTAIRVGADATVVDNQIVGHVDGIELFSNANVIMGNHMYNMGGLGLVTKGSSMGNTILNNYFDGCCVELARGGYMTNLSNNNFVSMDKYSAVYMTQGSVPAGWAQMFTMKNNTIIPYNTETPELYPLNINIDGGVATITNDKVFTDKMLGGIITDAYQSNLGQIIGILDNKRAKIMSFNGLTNGSYNGLFIKPTNVCFYSDKFTWANIVYDTINITDNRLDPGYALTSGTINGITKRLTDLTSTMGDNIDRAFLQVPCTFVGEKTITFNKRPKHIIVDAIINGAKGASTGYAKLNIDTSITNTCNYVYSETFERYRSDSECMILLCPDNQKMYVKVSEFGDKHIKLNFRTASTSDYKAFIDLQVF